jgi:LAS superfamily LD-carboxypeptidase LdcB
VVEGATHDVEKVLDGDVSTADEARAATARLARASAILDQTAQAIESEAAALERAAEAATYEDNLVALTSALALAPSAVTRVDDAVATVGRKVASDTVVNDALATRDALDNARAQATSVDRRKPAAVADALEAVTAGTANADAAIDAIAASHDAWLTAVNDHRAQVNEARLAAHEQQVALARDEHAEATLAAVAKHRAGWSGRPAGIDGSNGRLSASSLCTINFLPGALLQCDAARALEDADAAYHQETGRHLVVTDTYRSYGLQVTTRARKPSTAAVPGTSNHGWGMAIDLDGPSSAWLRENGERYGWVHPTWARSGGARPESWHLEYVAVEVGAFVAGKAPAILEPLESALPALERTTAEADAA